MKKSVRFLAFAVLAGSIFAVTGCSKPHNHSYSTDWSNDETNHWHSATCEHKELKKDEGAHEGMEDGYCDVCNYHVHLFDESKYAFDENNHWFADTCGHDQKKGEEAHTTNKLGVCTVCGNKVAEPDLSTVAKAIEIGVMQKGEVNSGTVIKETNYTDPSMKDHTVNGYFELGEDSFYMCETYSNNKVEIWYAIVNDITVGFEKRDDGDLVWHNEEFEAEAVNGYYFDGNEIGNAGNKSYGVEDYLETLYEVGKAKAIDGTFVESVNEGVYSFAYDLYTADSSDDVFNVAVSFELGEKYNVEKMNISVERWYYATDSDSDGVFEKPDTASDEQITTTITQETGALIEQEVKPEELLLSSFEIYNGEEKVEEELTLVCGTQLKLDVKNMLPESASNMTYDAISFTGVDANTGDEIEIDLLSSQYMGFYYKSSQQIGFNFKVLGTYEVTVHTRTLSKTFTVNVVRPATTELNVQVGGKNATTASVYLGDEVAFATVANQYADASATAVFTSKPDGSELIDADILVNESTGMFVFEPDVVGTYEITLTSVANPELEKTLTVTVEEKPAEVNVSSILNGKYKVVFYGEEMGTVTFTPSNATATEGTVVLAQKTKNNGLIEETFAYVYNGTVMEGTLALTFMGSGTATMSGWALGISNGALVNPANSSMQYQKVEDEPQQPEIVSPWEGAGTEADPYVITNFETDFTVVANSSTQIHYTFTADKSGTLTLTFDTSDTWVNLSEEGAMGDVLYLEKEASGTATIIAGKTYTLLIGSYDTPTLNMGLSMSFEEGEVGGGDEGGEDETPIWLEDGENTITVTADDITAEVISYLYMPWESGTYTFANDDGIVAIVYYKGMEIGRNQVSLDTLETYTIKLLVVAVEAGDYTLTISMEAEEGGDEGGESGDEVETWGSITVETTDNNCWVDLYTFTAPADGNYEFSLPEGLGLWSKGEYDSQGAPELDYYDNVWGENVTVYLSANEEYQFYVGATTKGEWVIWWSIVEGSDEPVVEVPYLEENTDNTITVTADDIETGIMFAMFMPSETAVYTFTSADGIAVQIWNADLVMIQPGTTLNGGELYEVYLNVAGLEAGDYVLTVAMVVEGGDDEGGDVSVPDGTKNNPYVITELPYEHKVTGNHDFYITYTATEDCTLKISYSAGCLVSDLPDGWVKDAENFFYTIAVTEGQVLKLNLWKTSGSDEYTYKFEKVVVVEPETPDVGGDEGGEENADVFTYIGEGAGRKMRVVVNKAENTIVVTRADYNNNLENGTTSNYTYKVENGEVVTTLVGTSSITSMTFNAEDISPVSIVCMGASYTGWVLQ